MSSSIYRSLTKELNSGKKAVVVTKLSTRDNSCADKFVLTGESFDNNNSSYGINQMILLEAQRSLKSGSIQLVQGLDGEDFLIEPYFPEPRLIILGGGHIAKPLAELAAKLDFLVTVVDDRPSFANAERFPDAEKVICTGFDKCFDLLDLNEASFVVIVTRGHRHDLECLKRVLNYKTAYVGMIGSKRRVKTVKEQLLDEGYSREKLDSVNAPIGLEIGAVTPEEIAVSIAAQLINYRRLVNHAAANTTPIKVNWPELDRAVLEDLCSQKDDPRALVTIVSTKGSVPRKAGAKMLVWPYGKTRGSIGGGCSEGEVIVAARDVIRNGGYMIKEIDMTGQVAEEEGMACGGIMKVIIEAYNG